MSIVDTHLHVIDKSRLTYPWVAGFEPLNRDFLYETYEAEARRVGITDVLHMEVDVAEDQIEAEIAYVGELAARPDSLIRGCIAAARPESADFPAFLDRVRADPIVKGFRRVLHTMPDDLSRGATFRENVKRLAGTGLVFDLVVLPHQIPIVAELVDLAPGVQFVLDHCGVPAIKDRAEHPWAEHVAEIARRPNVAVKVSGIAAYTDTATWTVDDLRPYVEHVIDRFGWDRVVWGSDWPVVTLAGTLSTWVAATHALTEGCSADEKAALLHRNARRLWRIPG